MTIFDMEEVLYDAIELVNNSISAYCHYITPNDLGLTGGHQCGFYFPHSVEPMFYGGFQRRGCNNDRKIVIKWQNSFTTDSRAVYYGTGTRNENRITRFGRGFEFLNDRYLGSLQIMTKNPAGEFACYILSNQDNIEAFINTFALDITARNQIINKDEVGENQANIIQNEIERVVAEMAVFPQTQIMAKTARNIVAEVCRYRDDDIARQPDKILPLWVATEYQLFKKLENKIYQTQMSERFADCQSLIDFSNTILNRRKSRAGKSLEHHLSVIFTCAKLRFESQGVNLGNKRPYFLFPDSNAYHSIVFPADKLVMLGAKTTCKDRWRQVLNEADRIPFKHLFTLQQGVSKNQLEEMKAEHLTLVVPKDNIPMFHPQYRDIVISLSDFCHFVKQKQL